MLHASGVIHGDLKQRNILRFIVDDLAKWILCDMDASALRGRTIGRKTSSAYAPPELARRKYAGDESGVYVAGAKPWALGAGRCHSAGSAVSAARASAKSG